jgi:hypothetical protein
MTDFKYLVRTDPETVQKLQLYSMKYGTTIITIQARYGANLGTTGGATILNRAKSRIVVKAVSYESTVPKNPSRRDFRILKDNGHPPRTAESVIPNI